MKILNVESASIFSRVKITEEAKKPKAKTEKVLSCLKNILLTALMFTSDQTFTTTLPVYKALLH